MPTHKQGTVDVVPTEGIKGRSGSTTLAHVFGASPIHTGELTDDLIREEFQTMVLDGKVNDGGHTFGEINRDYVDAPNYADVEVGGEGLPASAWAPNPQSPGPGSMNPADQVAAPDGYGSTPSDTPFSGIGSQLSPNDSSATISRHTLGDYGFGKSSS